MRGIFSRIVLSAFVFFAWSLLAFAFAAPATLIAGRAAALQFDNSDQSFLIAQGIMRLVNMPNAILSFVAFLILAAIWWVPVARAIAAITAAALALLVFAPKPASAYYNQTDLAEVYFILPNESAFYVPDAGANKDSQAKFGSEDYYKENKIAAKRFAIPHVILPKSTGYFQYDYYVNAGRMIIVDRTPVSREWVDAHDRGTAAVKQGFPCQSKEGLDITVGVTIGTSVAEENAPRFLYRFGVNPPQGNRNDPAVIFTSVYFGRSLAQIVDGPVRNKVQALVCNQIAAHSLDDDNDQATKIMTDIEKDVGAYLTSMGVTLDYIGWADTFTFGSRVQDAIDRRYVANKDAAIATQMQPFVSTIQLLASAEATRTLAGKWNGVVPSSVSLWWLPSSITDWLGAWTKSK